MKEYDIEITTDSNGNVVNANVKERSDADAGPLATVYTWVIYALCLIGGVIMLSNVAKDSPVCIIPAILGFIIMLIPIIVATNSGSFFRVLLVELYKYSDLLIGLILVMYWIAYTSQTVSIAFLSAITIGLMYLTGVSGFKVYQKVGIIGCVICTAAPIAVYLICSIVADEVEFGHLALIPTVSLLLSLFIREIANIYDFESKCLNDEIVKPIIKIFLYACIVASIILFSRYVDNAETDSFETAQNYIIENKFSEARELLQEIKSDEAKALYASIRYDDIKVGEIVYNGYYEFEGRSVSENGVAFICLDVVDNTALLISLDVIRLGEQYTPILDEDFYTSEYSFALDKIVSTKIADEEGKFFLLSKEQFDYYVSNDRLDDYLKTTNVSDIAEEQKKSVEKDTYKWTQPYIDIWLLNDFSKDDNSWTSMVGTIKTATGEYEKIQNMKVYAGIRLCYYVNVK